MGGRAAEGGGVGEGENQPIRVRSATSWLRLGARGLGVPIEARPIPLLTTGGHPFGAVRLGRAGAVAPGRAQDQEREGGRVSM